MKIGLLLLAANLPSVACIIGAVYMACQRIEGWGWLLFVAVLVHTAPKGEISCKGSKQDDGPLNTPR